MITYKISMSIAEIIKIEKDRYLREKKVYDIIYTRLQNKINNAVKARATECIYTIPEYIVGHPLVNIPKTMIYLLEKLSYEKFIATQLTEKDIYVTWNIYHLAEFESIPRPVDNTLVANKEFERHNENFVNSLIMSKKINYK
jgi:hypothetical protein